MKILFLIFFVAKCSSLELISPGLTSDSELQQIYYSKSSRIFNDTESKILPNVRAFNIEDEQDFNMILQDQNNTYFENENLEYFKNWNSNQFDYYLISHHFPLDKETIDISNYSFLIENSLPENQTFYSYDYILITKTKGGMAGSFEAMSHSIELFPIIPEHTYNRKKQAFNYGTTDIKFLRTIRVLCRFKKIKSLDRKSSLIVKITPDLEIKFLIKPDFP